MVLSQEADIRRAEVGCVSSWVQTIRRSGSKLRKVLLTMTSTIYDSPYWRCVLADYGLLAALEINLLDRPVHTGAECLVVVGAKTYVQDRGTMLVRLD
jgi:hypothetical protein